MATQSLVAIDIMIKKRVRIYKTRWHLLATFMIIIVPFIFLFAFAKISNFSMTSMYYNMGISFLRLLAAYIIAVILAWILAVAFFRGKRALVALPIFDVLQSFPTFAALPAAVYLWGATNLTVIFFLVITVIWPVLFSIISSLKMMRQDWEEAAQIYNLKGYKYLKNLILPVTIPGLITGSIVGLGEGWEALIATEIIVGVKSGLGSFFSIYSANFMLTALGILGFLMVIFTINKLIWIPLLERSHEKLEE